MGPHRFILPACIVREHAFDLEDIILNGIGHQFADGAELVIIT